MKFLRFYREGLGGDFLINVNLSIPEDQAESGT